jgi:hypothetical protein
MPGYELISLQLSHFIFRILGSMHNYYTHFTGENSDFQSNLLKVTWLENGEPRFKLASHSLDMQNYS